MIIDLTNNTNRIADFQSGQPMAYLRRAGLAAMHNRPRFQGGTDLGALGINRRRRGATSQAHGLGDLTDITGVDPTSPVQTGIDMTKVNAEALYLVNLARGAFGAAPLPGQTYAPTVNVGLSDSTKTLIGVGIAAVVLSMALHRR